MHPSAHEFVARVVASRRGALGDVVEVGARNINGSVRELFGEASSYLATDIAPGNGVERIVDATDADAMPAESCDTIVCCEVLEHAPLAPIVASVARWLRPGGILIATMATVGRAPHSAQDGGALRDGEYYENVTADAMFDALDAAGLLALEVTTNASAGDLYVLARKPLPRE